MVEVTGSNPVLTTKKKPLALLSKWFQNAHPNAHLTVKNS